jgi:hypothetical protein
MRSPDRGTCAGQNRVASFELQVAAIAFPSLVILPPLFAIEMAVTDGHRRGRSVKLGEGDFVGHNSGLNEPPV